MHVDWHPIRGEADLPTESGRYLATICEGSHADRLMRHVRIVKYDADDVVWAELGSPIWFRASVTWTNVGQTRVIAWRPMPKPYEEEA